MNRKKQPDSQARLASHLLVGGRSDRIA